MDVDRAATAHRAALDQVDAVKAAYAEQLRAARERVETTRTALAQAIVDAYNRGDRVGDLARRSAYSRETVRTILRSAGVEPD